MGTVSDIVYFFEHAARELDVACAVASLLREQGIHVRVVQWPHGFHKVSGQPTPKVVALPFCYNERSFAGCLLDWRQATYFNLSWEQLFYAGNEKAKTPSGAFALRHVIHHAWSDYYAQWLTGLGVPEANIFVNGHPAYAMYRPPYRDYFASRAELAQRHGLRAERRWIFFPENYNWAFYSPQTLQRFIDAGHQPSQIEEMRLFCDASVRATLHWCAEVAESTGVEIIVRPRPATPAQQFREFAMEVLGQVPQSMHIIQDETVREWVLASDVVVSSHSTTLIEAAVAGKPQFMLTPRAMPTSLKVDWHKLVPKISSVSELAERSQNAEEDSHTPLCEWADARLLGHGDPIIGLAKRLSQLADGALPVPPKVARRDAMLPGRMGVPRAMLFEARRVLRRDLRRRPNNVVEPEYLPDLAGEREVESRIERWQDIIGGGMADVSRQSYGNLVG